MNNNTCVLNLERLFYVKTLKKHQPHAGIACGRAVIIHTLLANARQIYGAAAIKSVHVIARKTMTFEVEAGADAKQ